MPAEIKRRLPGLDRDAKTSANAFVDPPPVARPVTGRRRIGNEPAVEIRDEGWRLLMDDRPGHGHLERSTPFGADGLKTSHIPLSRRRGGQRELPLINRLSSELTLELREEREIGVEAEAT